MGQLAFLKMFILVSIPVEIRDNRRHVHVFHQNGRHQRSVAKIWIEENGAKKIEVAWSELSASEEQMIVKAIDEHWDEINRLIDQVFDGKKIQVKRIK